MATITANATVRITRTAPNGRVKFVKTGVVGNAITPDYFEFTEDIDSSHPGRHVYVSTDESLPRGMVGWSQKTEVISV